ncbi:Unknown protein sequence [Pseudomonas syringae pv. syringae]|nr:Unknown protein sequence [Pseudomonas syringae pv. syringae]
MPKPLKIKSLLASGQSFWDIRSLVEMEMPDALIIKQNMVEHLGTG